MHRTVVVRAHAARTGSALVAGMLLLSLMISAAFLLTNTLVSDFTQQQQREADSVLLISTESAANQLYAALSSAPSTYLLPLAVGQPVDDTGQPTSPINTVRVVGSYQLLVNTTPAVKWGGQTYLVTVTGAIGDPAGGAGSYRRRRVEMVLRPQVITIFNQAMFAINGYDFMGSAMTDSFDSSVAAYAVPAGQSYAGSNGDIGSQGSIAVTQPTSGVHGAVNSGQTVTMPDLTYSVPPGAITVASPGSSGIASSYTFTQPGTYHTAFVNLSGGNASTRILRVQGGTVELYVDGAISFSGGQVQFDSTASTLIIHQSDYSSTTASGFSLQGNTAVGTIVPVAGGLPDGLSRPQQLQIYSMYSGGWTLNGTAQFSGVIFAPNATFTVNGTFDYMGSLIANAFASTTGGKVNGNFKFHYDTSLGSLNPDLEPRLQVVGWRTYTLGFDRNGG